MNTLKRTMRRLLRPRGWELRQFDPDLALDTFLWVLFEHFGINCVLDVGARVGAYGVLLRNNGYRGHILSFEPVRANFDRLQEACAGDPLWRAFPYALGDANGTAEINVSHGTNYSSFLTPSRFGEELDTDIAVERTEVVEVRRLDAIFEEVTTDIVSPRVYLKMDTQGFDLEVFRGASGCLDKVIALQAELSLQALYDGMPGWMAALKEFSEAGYEVSGTFAGVRDACLRLCEMDCVMVRCR
jgi:FkbM family methyltransferase